MVTENLERIKSTLEKKKIDLLLLTTEPNIRYLTGMYDLGCTVAIPTRDEPFIITNSLEQSRAHLTNFEIFSFSDKSSLTILKKILKKKKLKIKTVAYERAQLPIIRTENLQKLKYRLVDFSDDMSKIRSVKTTDEIKKIRRVAQLTVSAMRTAKQIIEEGITERALAAAIEHKLRKRADWFSFQTIVASGPNAAIPHHTTGDRKTHSTDLVIVDCGAMLAGYCSDMTRTFCLEPSSKEQKIHKVVLNAYNHAISKIKPHIHAMQIHNTTAKTIERSGYELIHGTGHGIGIDMHERPTINKNSKDILKPGMVFTIEPAVYINGFGGVRIEDMILLKDNGIEILTEFPRQLE